MACSPGSSASATSSNGDSPSSRTRRGSCTSTSPPAAERRGGRHGPPHPCCGIGAVAPTPHYVWSVWGGRASVRRRLAVAVQRRDDRSHRGREDALVESDAP